MSSPLMVSRDFESLKKIFSRQTEAAYDRENDVLGKFEFAGILRPITAVSCIAWNDVMIISSRARKWNIRSIYLAVAWKIKLKTVREHSNQRSTYLRLIPAAKIMAPRSVTVALPAYVVSTEILLRLLVLGAAA